MKLDSAHLELLAALASHDTMSAASEHINLSPSAASRRLQDAERRLGVRLVSLEGRSLELTAAGRLLADTATQTFQDLERAELAAHWFESGNPTPVRTGVGFFDQIGWLLPDIERHPFEIIRSPSSAAHDAKGAAVTIDVEARPHPDDQVILTDTLTLMTPQNHPLTSTDMIEAVDVAPHRYLASGADPLPGFKLESFFLPAGHGPTRIVNVGSFAMLVDLIAGGAGISIQPERAVAHLGRNDIASTPLATSVEVSWCVRVRDKSPQTKGFVEALTARLQA